MHCMQLPREVVGQSRRTREKILKRRLLDGLPLLAAAITGIEIFLEEDVHIDLVKGVASLALGSGIGRRSFGRGGTSKLLVLFLTRIIVSQQDVGLELL